MYRCRRTLVCTVVAAAVALGALPAAAQAHAASSPVATSFIAKVSRAPGGLSAKVVDGDQRLWLRAAPSASIVILDYRGAPYLRFSRAGVAVNRNSAMYYLNQTPPQTAPPRLTRNTPAKWKRVSSGHEYLWHDGRLQALASTAVAPGKSYVGRWSIPVLDRGHLESITGGVWHAPDPSLVWFWPIAVILACVLAAWRVRRPALHRRLAVYLAVAALAATAVGGVGRELYGHPAVSVAQIVFVVLILATVAWLLGRVLLKGPGYLVLFLTVFVALWAGGVLVPTLARGYVLTALPPFITRTADVLCLGCGVGLLLLGFRLVEQADRRQAEELKGSELRDGVAGEVAA